MSCYLAEDNLQVLLLLGKKFCVIRLNFAMMRSIYTISVLTEAVA